MHSLFLVCRNATDFCMLIFLILKSHQIYLLILVALQSLSVQFSSVAQSCLTLSSFATYCKFWYSFCHCFVCLKLFSSVFFFLIFESLLLPNGCLRVYYLSSTPMWIPHIFTSALISKLHSIMIWKSVIISIFLTFENLFYDLTCDLF